MEGEEEEEEEEGNNGPRFTRDEPTSLVVFLLAHVPLLERRIAQHNNWATNRHTRFNDDCIYYDAHISIVSSSSSPSSSFSMAALLLFNVIKRVAN